MPFRAIAYENISNARRKLDAPRASLRRLIVVLGAENPGGPLQSGGWTQGPRRALRPRAVVLPTRGFRGRPTCAPLADRPCADADGGSPLRGQLSILMDVYWGSPPANHLAPTCSCLGRVQVDHLLKDHSQTRRLLGCGCPAPTPQACVGTAAAEGPRTAAPPAPFAGAVPRGRSQCPPPSPARSANPRTVGPPAAARAGAAPSQRVSRAHGTPSPQLLARGARVRNSRCREPVPGGPGGRIARRDRDSRGDQAKCMTTILVSVISSTA